MSPTSPPGKRNVIVLEDFTDADQTVQTTGLNAASLPQFDLPVICDVVADPESTARRAPVDRTTASRVLNERDPAGQKHSAASSASNHPPSLHPVAFDSHTETAPGEAERFRKPIARIALTARATSLGLLIVGGALGAGFFLRAVMSPTASGIQPLAGSTHLAQTDPGSASVTAVSSESLTALVEEVATSGDLGFPEAFFGMRVFIDGIDAGVAAKQPLSWVCGEHDLRVGDRSTHRVIIPCGGHLVIAVDEMQAARPSAQ
ncbi:MAG: hypothetical protein NVS3B20_00020 [Polyangiales bacterium]